MGYCPRGCNELDTTEHICKHSREGDLRANLPPWFRLDFWFPVLEWQELAFSLEKAMASHFSTLAWKIPWMEEPGRLQSMGLLRVGRD